MTRHLEMVMLAASTKAKLNPMGFSFVLHDVPRDTLVQELHGGAQSNKVRGPGET